MRNRNRSRRAFTLILAECLAVSAIDCRDGVAPRVPANLSALSPITQDVVAALPLPQPPVVMVTDAGGHAMSGVSVVFIDDAPHTTPFIATSKSDGTASYPWFASRQAGVEHLTVRVQDLATVVFVANVHAGSPTHVVAASDLEQIGHAGGTLPSAPSVALTDAFGNPTAGVKLTFTASGPGAASIVNSEAVTDASGRATSGAWTLGSAPGEYTVTAADQNAILPVFVFRARVNVPLSVSQIAAGGAASCALANGSTDCWGAYLSEGATPATLPTVISGAPPLVSLAVGQDFGCGLTSAGAAYCWGSNTSGQLGNGTLSSYWTQAAPVSGAVVFTSLVAGDAFVCGLTTDQSVYCWGDNTLGQLGGPTEATARAAPAAVFTTEHFTTIAAGYQHVCAVATTGTTYCWGANDGGQLGGPSPDTCQVQGYDSYYYGPTIVNVSCARSPIAVRNAPGMFTALSAGSGSCGLFASGQAFCWGWGSSSVGNVPNDGQFTSLAAGNGAVCGITTAQSISCWSYGDPSKPPSTLTPVSGIASPRRIVAGHQHWCAIDGAGLAYCWGDNSQGQLGNGTRARVASPQPVAAP